MYNINKKRGQVWTTDFIIGLVLFILTLILGVRIMLDVYEPQDYTKLYREASHLSDSILSEGYPIDWNSTNVIIPGVADNNRINTTKLSRLKDLDYYHSKALLHVNANFAFFIRNSTTVLNTGSCVYGYNLSTYANCTPILPQNYNNFVKIDRTVIYNSSIRVMTFYVWD